MFIGSIGAIANGAAWPIFAILFADFFDAFTMTTGSTLMSQATSISLRFAYLALGSFVASYLEAGLWMWTGNRQANRIRQRYLSAVMRQEIAFFDTQATTGGGRRPAGQLPACRRGVHVASCCSSG